MDLTATKDQRISKRAHLISFLMLTAVIGVVAFGFLGRRGIWQPDEGYYAGTAVTMLERGTLVIPYLGEHEIFLDKPPMIYWGIIAGMKIFGHSEFAVRFFHGVCFVLTSLTVGWLAWSIYRDRVAAFLSALVYSTMIIPFVAGSFVTPDGILVLWTTLSALCFWKSVESQGRVRVLWQLALCASVGLGFLSKGPAALIPCGGMFVYLVIIKQAWRYFMTPWAIAGLAIFLAVGLGWYIWIGFRLPGAFSYLFESQVSGRLVTEKFNRNPGIKGALIYVPVVLLGTLPWSAIWIEKAGAVMSAIRRKKWWFTLGQRRGTLFLLCCFLVPLVILCSASSKLGLYALPLFAPLAIITAKWWAAKAPVTEGLSPSEILRAYSKPVKLTACWILLLVGSRVVLAYYPSHVNMKTLWSQVKNHVPAGEFEMCTVDERADGLIFYGAGKLEHITNKLDPYPTFSGTEHIIEEIEEFVRENEPGCFLVHEDDDIEDALKVLRDKNIECELIHLSNEWAILFPKLG